VSDPKEKVTGLFNLSTDMGEQKNLIQDHPEKAAELEALWREWNKKNKAPLWQPQNSLDMMRKAYGNEGMN